MDKRKKKTTKSAGKKTPKAAAAKAPAKPQSRGVGVFDLTQLRDIVALMAQNDLSLVHLEQEGGKLELRRGADAESLAALLSRVPAAAPVAVAAPQPAPAAVAPAATAPVAAAAAAAASDGPAGPCINSPMVGTFYRSAAPGDKAFVSVGDSVDENTTVCIIEAMKVMNEIKAEARGIVTRVLAEDGKPVQYGQPLFELKA